MLSDGHKKVGVNYGKTLEMGPRYSGLCYHHFFTKTDNIFQFAAPECHCYPNPTVGLINSIIQINFNKLKMA